MDQDFRILVAGGRGLIGSAIGRTLEKRSPSRVLASSRTDLDFRDRDATDAWFAAHRYGVKGLLNLDSSWICSRDCPKPIKEECVLNGPPEPTNEACAVAEIAAVNLCRRTRRQYGCNLISSAPTNLSGPSDDLHLRESHVLPPPSCASSMKRPTRSWSGAPGPTCR